MILDKASENGIGISNNVTNLISEERYMIVTAPEKFSGYWSTAIVPYTTMLSQEKERLTEKEIPDIHNIERWFVTFGHKEAMKRHAQIIDIVRRFNVEFWEESFPDSWPTVDPDGVVGGIISYSRNEHAWSDRYLKFEG